MSFDVYEAARLVSALKPGTCIAFDEDVLARAVPPAPLVGFFGPTWNPAERVMENVVGSAYEYRYHQNPITRRITFERLREPLKDNLRTYVSPDRRHLFRRRWDGLWEFVG